MKTLYENKSLPEIKWVEVQSKLQQAQSMESIARKNLEDASLYAPFDGVIGKRNVEAGENVQPGKPVFTLLDVGTVNIKIAVPEKEIPFIDHRKAAITVAALGGRLFEGMVTEKGITANPVSHTYEARIKLDNRDGALLPGMVCRVRVEDKDRVTTISLPNNVIQLSHTGERYVWCLRDGKAKAVTVRIGELTDNGVQITDGLSEGDLVITDGLQKVSEDMKVKCHYEKTAGNYRMGHALLPDHLIGADRLGWSGNLWPGKYAETGVSGIYHPPGCCRGCLSRGDFCRGGGTTGKAFGTLSLYF